MNKTYLLTVFILLALSISACARGGGRQAGVGLDVTEVMREPTVAVTAAPVAEVVATEPPASAMPPASATAPATFTPLATATVAASPTLAATATPDPYAGLTIADLRARTYGEGELRVEETIHVTDAFTRTLVSYPSDGLQVYGFMNVPFGEGPFPVALVLHGYIPPRQYGTIGYTTRYADWLARAGYLVLHPNYRNHPPSDETPAFATGA